MGVDGRSLLDPSGQRLEPLANFFAGDPETREGIRVTTRDLDLDGRADIIVGAAPKGPPRVTTYSGKDLTLDGAPPEMNRFNAFDESFLGGLFVG